MENIARVGVDVNEIASVRKTVDKPLNIPRFGLRKWARPMEEVGTGVGRCERVHVRAGSERRREVPEEVVVPIDVDASLACRSSPARRIAVLSPHRLVRVGRAAHAVEALIGIDVWEDNDIGPINDRLDVGCRERLAAVCQAGVGRVGLEEIGGEVDEDVRPAPFASMDSADEHERRSAGEPGPAPDEERVAVPAFIGDVR
jgi:hypothetical protein